MRLVGLSRQLAIAMGAIALAVAALIVMTSFGFYYLAFKLWPEEYPQGWGAPTLAEWIWLTLTTIAGVALAVLVAGHLAKRILVPLSSVTRAMRGVARGDLSARAEAGDKPLHEAAELVADFNKLASELQRVTEDRAFWNAAIAHELRTPVTVLRGRIQGIADGVFDADQTQFKKLLVQIEGLGRLVEDLRAISLAENGRLSVEWRLVDLGKDLADAADAFNRQLRTAGLELSLQLSADPVWCDPVRVRQAIMALLDNAKRYAVPGKVLLKSELVGDAFVISVEDEGPGVPPALAVEIFQAFRRTGTCSDPSERSSGLGLAVVDAIANAHSGTAWCQPSDSGGTAFKLSLSQRPDLRAL